MLDISNFEISVSSCFFGKDPYTSTKHVFYTIQTKRVAQTDKQGMEQFPMELLDSVAHRYSHLHRWHKKMCRTFNKTQFPEFPERPFSMLKLTRDLAKTSGDLNAFRQIRDMRDKLTVYFRTLQCIDKLANSFEFQQILPKSCHLREKQRNQGIVLHAQELFGFLRSQKVTINVNQKLKLIRLTVPKSSGNRIGRENLSFGDLLGYSMSPEGSKLKCSLHLKEGKERIFKFSDPADLDYFVDAVKSAKPSLGVRSSRTASLAGKTIGYIQKMKSVLRSSMMIENPEEMESLQKLSVFISSYNLARTNITPFAEELLHSAGKDHDIFAFGFQECRSFNGSIITSDSRIFQHILDFLGPGYFIVSKKSLWEISIVVFAKCKLRKHISNVECKSLATGFFGVVGNKGACAVSMRVYQTSFCFVTCHLSPHQKAVMQRNEMYKEIIGNLRIGNPLIDLNLQFDKVFWFGDLNYRLDLKPMTAVNLAQRGLWTQLMKKDQLQLEMSENRCFSGFEEPEIKFKPTYKLKMKVPTLSEEDSDSLRESESSSDDDDDDGDINYDEIEGRARSITHDKIFLDGDSPDSMYGTPANSALSMQSSRLGLAGRQDRSLSESARLSPQGILAASDDMYSVESTVMSSERHLFLSEGLKRTYNEKRVPSYTDRVLFCSNAYSGGLQGIQVKEYSDVVELIESDHNPVYGTFDVAVLKSVPSSVYTSAIEIYIGNVSIDFFQGFQEFRQSRNVFLCFHGPLMTEPVFSDVIFVKPDEFGDTIDLSSVSIPSLRLKMGDLYYLRYKRLFVSVCFTENGDQRTWTKESISMQASIPFFLQEGSASSRIDSLLYSNGILSGCIHGSVLFDRK